MVEYLEHGLSYHVAQELKCQDDATMATRLERAFMMADIHSNQLGVTMSGATVAVCLVKVRTSEVWKKKRSFDKERMVDSLAALHSYFVTEITT
jgi:hypothetical protein